MEVLQWQTHLNPVLVAGLILGLAVWLMVLYGRQRRKRSAKQALALLAPKVLIVLLVILAYFDPIRRVVQTPSQNNKVVVLVDMSSSMEIEDVPNASRIERAGELVEELTHRLPSCHIDLETLNFDSEVRDRQKDKQPTRGIRETDLGKCLVTMADKPNISDHAGVILITDGGDELLQNVKLPEVPTHIVGVGSDPESWNDVAIAEIVAPEVVEQQSDFEVAVDILARCASDDFSARLGPVKVSLEEKAGADWQIRGTELVRFTDRNARATFRVQSTSDLGTTQYRVSVQSIEGELSELNNTRVFPIEVQENALSVLLFAQQVGWDFSMIRKELSRDPSVALTSLFRVTQERFIVQGSRQEGDQGLEAGFPSNKELLGLYKCIILGSFPASQWQGQQLQALVEYVRDGGAVIFLGGEDSFGRGGYAGTELEALFPWRISDAEPELQSGQFAVNVPISAADHAIISETAKLISQAGSATVESVNMSGRPKSGAITLLNTLVGSRTLPVVALQRYGRGHTMAVATNTLWKWTLAGETLEQAYGHFWRQAVRNLSQWAEGEHFLAVRWDRPSYRPGEQAQATIRVAGRYDPGQLQLKAALNVDGNNVPVAVEPVAGKANTFRAEMSFAERAEYLFKAEAYSQEQLLESYEKTLAVGPKLNEGANLEVDRAFLDNLAARGGGAYFREGDFENLIEALRNQVMARSVSLDIPLVQDKTVYLLIFLGILMVEWTVRRKMNLF